MPRCQDQIAEGHDKLASSLVVPTYPGSACRKIRKPRSWRLPGRLGPPLTRHVSAIRPAA